MESLGPDSATELTSVSISASVEVRVYPLLHYRNHFFCHTTCFRVKRPLTRHVDTGFPSQTPLLRQLHKKQLKMDPSNGLVPLYFRLLTKLGRNGFSTG